jgi:predicted nucleic-acid-binding protein
LIGLDTNVLVRFFLQDDPLQSPRANGVMAGLTVEDPGWVGVATILELAWVLASKNRFDRKTIANTLERLLMQEAIVVEHSEYVENAVQLFCRGNADFADCLISSAARAANCSRTVTFDRIAARDAAMELLIANP